MNYGVILDRHTVLPVEYANDPHGDEALGPTRIPPRVAWRAGPVYRASPALARRWRWPAAASSKSSLWAITPSGRGCSNP